MNLPKLYAPVWIRFSSLRDALGESLGVIHDCDALVERKVIRVNTGNGWKWQLKDYHKLIDWDYYADTDKEILDNYGSDLEFTLLDGS